jgi:hypothetical protein
MCESCLQPLPRALQPEQGLAMVETIKGSEADKVAVADRSEGVGGVIRLLCIPSIPCRIATSPGRRLLGTRSCRQRSRCGGIALDGLSNTARLLSQGFEPPLAAGWHVVGMPADRLGAEATRRVARMAVTESLKGKYIDGPTSNCRRT